jgi:ribosomal protein S27AE
MTARVCFLPVDQHNGAASGSMQDPARYCGVKTDNHPNSGPLSSSGPDAPRARKKPGPKGVPDEVIVREILRALIDGSSLTQIAKRLGACRHRVVRIGAQIGFIRPSGFLIGNPGSGKGGRRTRAELNRRWREVHKEKWAANKAVERALKRGLLTREPCEHCGAEKAQAHHHDYSKPLDVQWLCQKCHSAEHARLRNARAANVY